MLLLKNQQHHVTILGEVEKWSKLKTELDIEKEKKEW